MAFGKGAEACSGCSLCLLVCPVWHTHRDIRLSPQGRSKALQHGADVAEVADSVQSCTLCGACEPACPEQIPLVSMVLELRNRLAQDVPVRLATVSHSVMNGALNESAGHPAHHAADDSVIPSMNPTTSHTGNAAMGTTDSFFMTLTDAASTNTLSRPFRPPGTLLLPDQALAGDEVRLGKVIRRLAEQGVRPAADAGADITLALESGEAIPEARLTAFLHQLTRARRLIVGDGLLFRALRHWLPGTAIESLGAALSGLADVASRLRRGDYYVIEPRAYHADRERLLKHYSALRQATGCSLNLDLQRLAMATTAGSIATLTGRSRIDVQKQALWMLEGSAPMRIVVEDLNDAAVFSSVTPAPVVPLSELADA